MIGECYVTLKCSIFSIAEQIDCWWRECGVEVRIVVPVKPQCDTLFTLCSDHSLSGGHNDRSMLR
jgi:hypothetical protein